MPREQGPRRSLWLRVGRETTYPIVTCPPRSVMGHWDSGARRMRRCGHDLCSLCQAGWSARAFWYIGVREEGGQPMLLELREAQADLRRELSAQGWNAVGIQLAVYKDGPASNSPIRMHINGREPCEAWDVAAVVSALGLAPALREPVQVVTDPAQEGDASAFRRERERRKALAMKHDA